MVEVTMDDFSKIVVGVDPSVTSGENADETGIVVVARGPHQDDTCNTLNCTAHGYVLQDATLPKSNKNSVDKWARRVVEVFDTWQADLIVIEGNQGHELLDMALRTVRNGLPVSRPNARDSKKTRMEPIVALYEQGRIHHIGDPMAFADLEEQMTTWVPPLEGKRGVKSPDRVDALVWALAELNLQGRKPRSRVAGISPVGFGQTNEWKL
jgi:phage terminase large subunit-like protein